MVLLPMAVRKSSMLLAWTILLIWCSGVLLLWRYNPFCATWQAATESSSVLRKTESPAPTLANVNTVIDLNWTACPSKNELQSARHFSLWDEKLAQALRLSAPKPPQMEQESWHAVTDNIHVFSAFLVTTENRAIHITSLVRSHINGAPIQHPPLMCIIRNRNGTITREAHIRLVWTWLNPSFKNALIMCPPLKGKIPADEDIRVAVAVRGSGEDSLKWLHLHRPPERVEEKCCAVCVRPSFGSSISLWKITEFITHYRLMGASRFYFYDLDMPSDTMLLLARLQSTGVDVTLVPFKLIADTADVHAHGQMPGLYDCMFRSMSRTEYYVHVDIDELMVPLRDSNIPALVHKAEQSGDGFLGSLVVPSRYHCAEYPVNLQYSQHEYVPLQTRLFTYESMDLYKGGFTKYIARSRTVCEAGVHNVMVHCAGYSQVRLRSSVAFINHYRRCCEFPPESAAYQSDLPLRNISNIGVHYSFMELSARIERDPAVRSLKELILQIGR